MKTEFEVFCARKRVQYGDKFDPSELDARFVPAFNFGKRVRVNFYGTDVKTGTISVTSGWKPVFLLMLTARSITSSWVLGKGVEFTTEKVGYRRQHEVR